MSGSNPYASKEAWTAAILRALTGPEEEVESTFLTLYTKETDIKIDGKTYDFPGFLANAAHVRSISSDIELKSHCFLRDGNFFAEKHTLTATLKHDGSKIAVEGYIFGELNDDNKAVWVDEQPRTART
jgi:hypothetical protein